MPSILLRDAIRGVLVDFFTFLALSLLLGFGLGYFMFFGG